MSDLLKEYPVVLEIPVAWGDMDALRHVNNVMYFRWFESARLAYFEAIGFMETIETEGVGPILASTSCRFRYPLTYPDTVSVGARVLDLGEDRFNMGYAVASQRHDRLAAVGEGLIVAFDYRNNTKAVLPSLIVEKIRTTEGK